MRTNLFLLIPLLAQPAPEAPATLRVDYFHSGNDETEIFSLDRVVREPLAWPGNPRRPLDGILRGKYVFEIWPAGADRPAYSRSFSSIYGEWETTAEAGRISRSFHESVRFPDPGSEFELVIRKRGPDNAFSEVWRIALDSGDYLVHQQTAAYADRVVALERNGDPADKVDLLLLGDGYTAAESEAFLERARELVEGLFSRQPFRERRADFNVWALAPAARDSGVSRPSTGVYRDSPLGSRYDAFRSERYVLSFDNPSLREVAASAPYDFIEILTNSETYGGGEQRMGRLPVRA